MFRMKCIRCGTESILNDISTDVKLVKLVIPNGAMITRSHCDICKRDDDKDAEFLVVKKMDGKNRCNYCASILNSKNFTGVCQSCKAKGKLATLVIADYQGAEMAYPVIPPASKRDIILDAIENDADIIFHELLVNPEVLDKLEVLYKESKDKDSIIEFTSLLLKQIVRNVKSD